MAPCYDVLERDMPTEEDVINALRKCHDPELGLSIVDLGLIYGVEIEDEKVKVDMTLTAPGCPLQAMIAQDAHSKVLALEGVREVEVNLVFEPKWTPDRMSPEAKRMLGWER